MRGRYPDHHRDEGVEHRVKHPRSQPVSWLLLEGGPARSFGLSHPGALAALSEIHLGSRYPLGHFRGCFGLRLRFAVLPDLVGQLRHPLFTIVRCVTPALP